jgi:hypothetical protein
MRAHDLPETDDTFRRVRILLRKVGQHGGSITPSVYETAQVLRFSPHLVEAENVTNWLLHRQQPDGGWEHPEAPLYRIVPTLAAVLALHEQGRGRQARAAAEAGVRYLAAQTQVIDPSSAQYLPVAMELILPRLLDDAEAAGIALPRGRFQHIDELRQLRLALIGRFASAPNSPPMFSWEAWGTEACPELVGAIGGVGHSPAATAWWLRLDGGHQLATGARERAQAYLAAASQAGGAGIRGVVPGPWPMNRFEQSFVLHMLVISGLAARREIAGAFAPQMRDLQSLLTRNRGVGFSDCFSPDGDDTAAAVGVLAVCAEQVDGELLAPFRRPDHFVGYPFEMHIAHTVTARATQALGALGYDVEPWRRAIVAGQQPDGWWRSEKWNRSRLYGTLIALSALPPGPCPVKAAAARGFLQQQQADGGWGCFGASTPVETAFGILALWRIAQDTGIERDCLEAIVYAHNYLRVHGALQGVGAHRMWISKDLYSARRIDQAVILSALATPYLLPKQAPKSVQNYWLPVPERALFEQAAQE